MPFAMRNLYIFCCHKPKRSESKVCLSLRLYLSKFWRKRRVASSIRNIYRDITKRIFLIFLLGALEKYVKILEDKYKTAVLRTVYAGVNRKSADDPDIEAFFKMKFW